MTVPAATVHILSLQFALHFIIEMMPNTRESTDRAGDNHDASVEASDFLRISRV